MSRLHRVLQARRARREQYRSSIQYAIAHACTERERTELTTLAGQQGALV